MAENVNKVPEEPQNGASKGEMPTADEMLERLHAVDLNQFDLEMALNQIKGNKQWVSILTIPVSAILLVLITLVGAFMTDQLITSFIVAAVLVYSLGKFMDQFDQQYRIQARNRVMQRIAETEGRIGLIPHFKNFLPTKYRHLWQSLRKGRYMYIDQYRQALQLLQNKLDPEAFRKIWHIQHPETDPDAESAEEHEDEATSQSA